MTLQDKELFFYNIKDLCEYLETKCCQLVEEQHEVLDKDFDSTVKMIAGDDGDYLTTVLDAQMDTMVKTMLNIIVMVQTEKALHKSGHNPTLPDPVEYVLQNKELYGIGEEEKEVGKADLFCGECGNNIGYSSHKEWCKFNLTSV